jgi:hypothetical protein
MIRKSLYLTIFLIVIFYIFIFSANNYIKRVEDEILIKFTHELNKFSICNTNCITSSSFNEDIKQEKAGFYLITNNEVIQRIENKNSKLCLQKFLSEPRGISDYSQVFIEISSIETGICHRRYNFDGSFSLVWIEPSFIYNLFQFLLRLTQQQPSPPGG